MDVFQNEFCNYSLCTQYISCAVCVLSVMQRQQPRAYPYTTSSAQHAPHAAPRQGQQSDRPDTMPRNQLRAQYPSAQHDPHGEAALQHARQPGRDGHRHDEASRATIHSKKSRPAYNPHRFGKTEIQNFQEENLHGDRLCELCSDRDHKVYHHHIS